jgi:hypothetical protein
MPVRVGGFEITAELSGFSSVCLQQRVSLPRAVALDLMAEAFEVSNRPNWTITTQESGPQYPAANVG